MWEFWVFSNLQKEKNAQVTGKIINLTRYCIDQCTLVVSEAAHTVYLSKLPSENFVVSGINYKLSDCKIFCTGK